MIVSTSGVIGKSISVFLPGTTGGIILCFVKKREFVAVHIYKNKNIFCNRFLVLPEAFSTCFQLLPSSGKLKDWQ